MYIRAANIYEGVAVSYTCFYSRDFKTMEARYSTETEEWTVYDNTRRVVYTTKNGAIHND